MSFEIKDNILYIDEVNFCLPNLLFLNEINGGANAKVFLAFNNLLNRQEAIKIWVPRKGQAKVDETRFKEEVKKNANANFPSVANFYDANIENGFYYARLEYIQGQTLSVFLQKTQEFVFRYSILKTILETMISVYDAGFYHGDFHTGNVIINEWKPYIIDFGTSIFSGKILSQARDCQMLVELCFEVLPELQKLNFLDKNIIIAQGSKIAAEFLLRCASITWNLAASSTFNLDGYAYKDWLYGFDDLAEDFQFLDSKSIEKFFKESFSKEKG